MENSHNYKTNTKKKKLAKALLANLNLTNSLDYIGIN